MAEPSAHAKRTDQMYMSLSEYKKLAGLSQFRGEFRQDLRIVCGDFEGRCGKKALNRLKAQAKREGISPLEKLCRLERLSQKK